MWETLRKEEVERKLGTNFKNGLTNDEVSKRQNQYGKNELENGKKEGIIIKFFKQFNDFMIIILIMASIVSAGISWYQGENDYIDSIIIIAIVVLNALMGVLQEAKAERSIESLKKMTPQMSKVIREGKEKEIKSEDLTVGDIVILEAGNSVPADCRIIESYNLKIEESSLTGETQGIEKDGNVICKKGIPLGDIVNMAFMGSTVVNGHAKVVVTDIGMNTKVGKIANMIIENESPETPIQKKLNQVGKILGVICLIICLVIFVIGIIKKIPPMEMFMTSVGLAVAAIPEGLPAIVTIMLSIGVTKMSKRNSIIRKLPAVETLGSSNVICSDKTGTLTQNKMKVVEIKSENPNLAMELGAMCTDSKIEINNGKVEVVGEPTEIALVEVAYKNKLDKNELYKAKPRINEIPFDSNRKMMTTIHKLENGKYRVITKGAPDILLNRCIGINKEKILKENEKMANKALRVIAVTYKDIDTIPNKIDSSNIEKNLNFVGLIGMIDPPREGVKEAVETCKKAGIKTVMITGDHIATAKAIAEKIGILTRKDKAITGAELDKINQETFEKEVQNYTVFARVTPEHKVRIVKAWQKKGAVVAMTGDGVNDSPALKSADIGIAMGKGGTEVARAAADMVLTDDNFSTIVSAVEEGRVIYGNIRKTIHFLISCNIGEILLVLAAFLLGLPAPLLAIQLLWVNLVTDSLPALALGVEPAEPDSMKRKPVSRNAGVFSGGMGKSVILEGCLIGALALLAFTIGRLFFDSNPMEPATGRTMAFAVLSFSQIAHTFNMRSEHSLFTIGVFSNPKLILSAVICVLLQWMVIAVPAVSAVFRTVSLTGIQWVLVVVISFIPIFCIEIEKKLFRTASKNKIS